MVNTKYLCTLFDSGYLLLGLSLIQSVERHFSSYKLWVLAMDEPCYQFLKSLSMKNVHVMRLSEIEDKHTEVAKNNRTWQEYCWTLSPILPSYILEQNKEIDHITYLDADIFFYSSPDPIYDEIGSASIMITPHRFPQRLKEMEINGIFNVQMVFFRRDEEGLKCLARWRQQCLEWCYYKLEDGKMGDQKYLDEWPYLYKNICILKNEQSGVALWNLEDTEIEVVNGIILANRKPLIFYHFHKFKYYNGWYTDGANSYSLPQKKLRPIYKKYVEQIRENQKRYSIKSRTLKLREKLALINQQELRSSTLLGQLLINVIFFFGQIAKKTPLRSIFSAKLR